MGKMKINKKLIEKISSFDWAKEVNYLVFKTVKGKTSSWISVDVDCGYIDSKDEFLTISAQILDDIREIDKLVKIFDGHIIKLKAKDEVNKMNDINFVFGVLGEDKKKEIFGAIMDCKLIEHKHTYTSLSCGVKK